MGEGCWEWTAARKFDGYGLAWFDKRLQPAHRVAYRLVRGDIPEGMLVCHHCDNPGCQRPSHLFLGSHRDNSADMWAKGRGVSVRGPKRTHCKRGHELTPDNLYWSNSKQYRVRKCRICTCVRQRKYMAAKRDAA